MSKIVLNDVLSGFNLTKINDNFQRIKDEFDDKVMYRDNPLGEANTMENVLDMNGHSIINVGSITGNLDPVTAGAIPFVPYRDIASTNVQEAIQEVRDDIRLHGVTPQEFGAVGGGVVDDTTAFLSMFATGKPWYIPYVAGGYKISSTLTISADGICDGTLMPTAAIGGAALDLNRFAVVISSAGYAVKRVVRGIKIQGNVTVRAAFVKGIRNDCENSVLENCYCSQLDFGIVVRSYSVTLRKCNASQCNTNLSAYAPAANQEINALVVDGGNYDSPVNYAANIGDARWAITLPASTSHGVGINFINGANFDGGEIKIESCSVVNIVGCYSEASATGVIIRLGGAGDGYVRNVNISNNFFKNANYVVKCGSAVEKLVVKDNFVTQVPICEVWLTSDIYGLEYRPGVQVGSFNLGRPVRLAFRSLAVTNLAFTNFTLGNDYLFNGVYGNNTIYPVKWYPGTIYTGPQGLVSKDTTSSIDSGVYYTTPALTKAGTVSSNVFTFTTPADSYAFNGGDRILTAPAGATYVRSVDYAAGTMLLDGGVTANGAATASQRAPYITSQAVRAAIPVTGTWSQGDVITNSVPAVGSPKGWMCTVSGTPGTWVSQGNL